MNKYLCGPFRGLSQRNDRINIHFATASCALWQKTYKKQPRGCKIIPVKNRGWKLN